MRAGRFVYLKLFFTVFLAGLTSPLVAKEGKAPSVLYLTWMHDTTTTMTVQWHTLKKKAPAEIAYRKIGSGRWKEQSGLCARVRKTNLYVNTVELLELEPGAEYEFRVVGKKGAYRFKTLPKALSNE